MSQELTPDILASIGLHDIYNFKPQNVRKIRAGVQRVRLGISRFAIGMVGDSTYGGIGAGVPLGATPDSRKWAAPDLFAAYLSDPGSKLYTRADSIWGVQGLSNAGYLNYNPKLTVSAGWQSTTGVDSLGGKPFKNSTDTGAYSVNFGTTFDRIVVGYWKDPTNADDLTVDIGGGTLVTLAGTGPAAYTVSAPIVCTRGQNTINVKRVGTKAQQIIFFVRAYDSTQPAVEIYNWGISAAPSSTMANSTANAIAPGCDYIHAMQTQGLDCAFIKEGINDLNTAVPVATFKANVQTQITAVKPTADAVLVTPNPVSIGDLTPYVTALKELAVTNNCVLIDLFGRYGGSSATPLGTFQTDGWNFDSAPVIHPNSLSYSEEAAIYAQLIRMAA
jgi:hypothetical protein